MRLKHAWALGLFLFQGARGKRSKKTVESSSSSSSSSSWTEDSEAVYQALGRHREPKKRKQRRKKGRGVLYSAAGSSEFIRREVLPTVRYLSETLKFGPRPHNSAMKFAFAVEARPLWAQLGEPEKSAITAFFDDVLPIADDDEEKLPLKARVKYLKIRAMALSPFAETLYLDFDSRPCRQDFAALIFRELDDGDVALTNKFAGQADDPEMHFKMEHNSACVAYRGTSAKVARWFQYYEYAFLELQRKPNPSGRDQPAMMVALRRAVLLDGLQHNDIDANVFCRSKISKAVSCDAGCAVVHKPQKHDTSLKVFVIGAPATGADVVARMLDAVKIEPRLNPADRLRALDAVLASSTMDWRQLFDDVLGPTAAQARVFYDAPWNVGDAYKVLASTFPRAKFILTTRSDRTTWEDDIHRGLQCPHQRQHQLARLDDNAVVTPAQVDQKTALRELYERRNQRVREYFAADDTARFLELQVTGPGPAKNVWATLCGFVEAWTTCPTTRHIPQAVVLCDPPPPPPQEKKVDDSRLALYKERVAEHLRKPRQATSSPPKVFPRPFLTKAQKETMKRAIPLSKDQPRWHDACSPVSVRGVFYNRIPKSGSASVMSWMSNMLNETAKFLQKKQRTDVTWWTPHVAKHRWLDDMNENELVSTVRDFGLKSRFVTQRHVYHTPALLKADPGGVAFVNVVRDPIDRCLSRYNYEAFYKKRIPPVDLDVCMDTDPHCDFDGWSLEREQHYYQDFPVPKSDASPQERAIFLHLSYNQSMALFLDECHDYMTRWFCGHGPECRDAQRPALALDIAKRNIRDHYVHVGVLEDLPNTVQLFRLRLPSFFQGNPDHTPDEADFPELHSAKTLAARSSEKEKKKQRKSRPLRPENLEKLLAANQRDLNLYHYILDLHRRRVKLCLQTNGTSSSERRSSRQMWAPPLR